MASATFNHEGFDLRFDDSDVVNPGDLFMDWPLWLLHDHGFTVAVVFATCEGDALDAAADAGKLDPWSLAEEEDYPEETGVQYLGNHGKPFDIESLGIVKLACPAISVAALVMAAKADQATARRAAAREEVKG